MASSDHLLGCGRGVSRSDPNQGSRWILPIVNTCTAGVVYVETQVQDGPYLPHIGTSRS